MALALVGSAQTNTTSVSTNSSKMYSPEDGQFDVSGFLDERYGFLPVVLPITEPAVGYGAAGGVAFISEPLGKAAAGFGRPNITMVGGMGTQNGSWSAVAGDVRHWLDDRVQTLAGVVYASVNLDFHGIGNDSVLAHSPLRYNLQPAGGTLQGKYRLGDSRFWAGVNYAYARTHVKFDAPAGAPGLPNFQTESTVSGFTLSISYDSRDNIFTPTRGAFVEATFGVFSDVFGGDDDFQRARVTAIQYLRLSSNLYLGVRGDVAASFGDEPFYLRPFISVRGAPIMRYQGEEIAQIEAELRWQVWKRWSVVGFVGAGAMWNNLERFDNSRSILTGGTGFRYELARKYGIHAGVDVAFSAHDAAIYVQIGSAWARP
jgi:outer membrane protein assembly factor BamA